MHLREIRGGLRRLRISLRNDRVGLVSPTGVALMMMDLRRVSV